MTQTQIRECLGVLYEATESCEISVSLIQKLAQFLKLETFIDKIDHVSHSHGERLSIAGQLILIDIDYTLDSTISTVQISREDLGKQQEESSTDRDFYSIDDNKIITIDLKENPYLLFKPKHGCSTRDILHKNLNGPKIGKFAQNLKYLAEIDHLLVGDVNTYACLEHIAAVLGAIESVESNQFSKTFRENLVGSVEVNGELEEIVGMRLRFWQDWRYLRDKLQKPPKIYSLLVKVEENFSEMRDYLAELMPWAIGEHIYDIKYINKSETKMNARLTLELDEALSIPYRVLEYLGIEYRLGDDDIDLLLSALDHEETPEFQSGNITIKPCHECGREVFKRVKMFAVSSIQDISTLLQLLRSCIVLRNVYRQIQNLEVETETSSAAHLTRSRKSSIAPELSQEARSKLRESLKLSSTVTDEELLGLRAMSDKARRSLEPSNIDIFMDVDTAKDNKDIEESVLITLKDVDVVSGLFSFAIEAHANGKHGYSVISLHNGVFSTMEQSTPVTPELAAFLQALNWSEDFLRAVRHLYYET